MAHLVRVQMSLGRLVMRNAAPAATQIRRASQQTKTELTRMKANPVTQSKVTNYFLARYIAYVKGFQTLLETNFPSAMHVYRVFSVGIMDFFGDLKLFLSVARRVHTTDEGLRDLQRKDLEVYYQMPKDMQKMVPVLLVAALPFANYVVFPLAYMFPKKFLTRHFWSLQQRIDFARDAHKKKLYSYKPVFRCLQAQLDSIKDTSMRQKCERVMFQLGSGTHPEVDEIMGIEPLFRTHPYHLNSIYVQHVNGLLKVHGLNPWFLKRKRLKETAVLIHEMDRAILKEGISSLGSEEVRWACFIRGLNPVNMRDEDIVHYLEQWTQISLQMNEDNLSLLLHAPILLAYNHPTNWGLIH